MSGCLTQYLWSGFKTTGRQADDLSKKCTTLSFVAFSNLRGLIILATKEFGQLTEIVPLISVHISTLLITATDAALKVLKIYHFRRNKMVVGARKFRFENLATSRRKSFCGRGQSHKKWWRSRFFESEGRRKIKWKKTEREKNSNDFEKDFKNLVPKDFLKISWKWLLSWSAATEKRRNLLCKNGK